MVTIPSTLALSLSSELSEGKCWVALVITGDFQKLLKIEVLRGAPLPSCWV